MAINSPSIYIDILFIILFVSSESIRRPTITQKDNGLSYEGKRKSDGLRMLAEWCGHDDYLGNYDVQIRVIVFFGTMDVRPGGFTKEAFILFLSRITSSSLLFEPSDVRGDNGNFLTGSKKLC